MAGRTYQTAIEIGAKLASSFKAVTGGASGALQKLSVQTAKLNAAERSTEGYARLTTRVADATVKYNKAADALDRLTAAEKAAGGPTKESAKWIAAGARAVKQAEQEMVRAKAAAGNMAAALHLAGVDTSKLTQEQTRLARALAITERKANALKLFQSGTARIATHAGKARQQLSGLASTAMRAGGVVVGAAGGLFALAHRTAEAGDEIGDMAANLGLGNKSLQELRFAAEAGGSSAEDLDKGFAKFNQVTGDALVGNQAAVKSFNDLGIKMLQIRNATPEQRFNLVVAALGKIPDPAVRASRAQDLLGKSSKSLVALLGQGIENLDALRAKTVGVLSDDQIEAAGKAKDAMQRARAAFGGVANILGAQLLPVATRTLERITAWLGTNQAKVAEWGAAVATWVEGRAIPALEKWGPQLLALAQNAAVVTERVIAFTGGISNAAILVGAFKLLPLAVSLGQVAVGFGSAAVAAVNYARAAAAASTASGVAGAGVVGLLGKLGALGAAAGTGFAIGTALDSALGISDRIGGITGAKESDAAVFAVEEEERTARVAELRAKRNAAIAAAADTEKRVRAAVPPIEVVDRTGTAPPAAPALLPRAAGNRGSGAPGALSIVNKQEMHFHGETDRATAQAAAREGARANGEHLRTALARHEAERRRVSLD